MHVTVPRESRDSADEETFAEFTPLCRIVVRPEILRNKLKHLNIDWGFVSFESGSYLKAGLVTI